MDLSSLSDNGTRDSIAIYIIKLCYIKSPYVWCVYVSKLKYTTFVYLVLYVDDILIAAKKMCDIEKLKEFLNSKYEINDLAAGKKIPGMEIFKDGEKKLFLSRKTYINKVLKRFVVSSDNFIGIPCALNVHLTMYMILS